MRVGVGVAVLLTVVTACSHSGAGPTPPVSTTVPLSRQLKIIPSTVVRPGDEFIESLALWDHYVAWAAGDSKDPSAKRVVVLDLATNRKRVVARAVMTKGQIGTVIGHGDMVVYSELAHQPTTATPDGENVPWSEYLVDLKTGSRRKILSFPNHDPKGPVFPRPRIEMPWIVEELPAIKGRGLDLKAYDLRTNRWKTIRSNIRFGSGFDLVAGNVIFAARSGEDQSGTRTDVFSMPIDGSIAPRQLTHSGVVEDLTAANGGASWHEPVVGDPASLWWIPLNVGGEPLKFRNAGGFGPYPGNGFVTWIEVEGEALLAQAPTANDPPVQLAGDDLYIAGHWAAFDDRVAWATQADEASPIEIHIARISAA